MLGLLSNPGHAASFDHLGGAYIPLRCLVEQLARREYAGGVYAFKSIYSFNLTMAPTYQEAAGHDEVSIGYYPSRGLFGVIYHAWESTTRNPRHRTAARRACEAQEAGEIIDRFVLRLLMSQQRPKSRGNNSPSLER